MRSYPYFEDDDDNSREDAYHDRMYQGKKNGYRYAGYGEYEPYGGGGSRVIDLGDGSGGCSEM